MLPLVLALTVVLVALVDSKPPHIILVIGDDLGFNDVSFRGSEDIHTPNIDALGYAGRILDRHYVLPTCTPSRASLLTGQYAIRTGTQGYALKMGEPRGLPLHFTILPQFLKKLNYSTHLIGKWHEGNHRWVYTPTYRGYDTFLGYYNGMVGYFTHEVSIADWPDPDKTPNGYDMHRNERVAFELRGRYATDLFTAEAEKLIYDHDPEKPLFLQFAHIAPHAGEGKTHNEVANEGANDRRYGFIKDGHRRRYAGATAAMDESVGRIVDALADRDMLADSLIVFFSDNGGATVGRYNNSGSNYPLRGQKETVFEGGVRSAAVVWHPDIKPTSELNTDLFHISDWLPTFYEAAGGNLTDLGKIDGVSQWERLLGKATSAPRNEVFVNSRENEDASYIHEWWKYIEGNPYILDNFVGLMGSPGHTAGRRPYALCGVVNSATSKNLFQASKGGDFERLGERAAQLRKLASLPSSCRHNATEVFDCANGCLFNLRNDPCEAKNLVDELPEITSMMRQKLRSWDPTIVPQLNTDVDITSNPEDFGGAWVPWLDMQRPLETASQTVAGTAARSSKTDVAFLITVLSSFLAFFFKR